MRSYPGWLLVVAFALIGCVGKFRPAVLLDMSTQPRDPDPTRVPGADATAEPPSEHRGPARSEEERTLETVASLVAVILASVFGASDLDGDGNPDPHLILGIRATFEEAPSRPRGARHESAQPRALDACLLRATDGRCVPPQRDTPRPGSSAIE